MVFVQIQDFANKLPGNILNLYIVHITRLTPELLRFCALITSLARRNFLDSPAGRKKHTRFELYTEHIV